MNGDETETNEQLMAEPVALKREGKTARNREDETLYTFFSRLPIGIYLVQDGKFKFVNSVGAWRRRVVEFCLSGCGAPR